MGGFWYPYESQDDATARLSGFADHQFGIGCGVTWSDGQSVAILRKASITSGGHGAYVNILRQHVAAPPSPAKPSAPSTFLQRAEAFFEHAMELEGDAEIENAQAQQAASQAMFNAVRDNVWEPAHRFMLRHKQGTDLAGVVIDAVGVFAGVAFVIALSPELGALAIATGVAAAVGSGVLPLADGAVYATEATGQARLAARGDLPWTSRVSRVLSR